MCNKATPLAVSWPCAPERKCRISVSIVRSVSSVTSPICAGFFTVEEIHRRYLGSFGGGQPALEFWSSPFAGGVLMTFVKVDLVRLACRVAPYSAAPALIAYHGQDIMDAISSRDGNEDDE